MKILEDYYKAKLSLEILTLEVKEKQEAVMAFLESQEDQKAEIPQAKFVIRTTPIYKFSNKVDALEEDVKLSKEAVKDEQKGEIEAGIATIVDETRTVMMVKTKEK